MQEDQNIEFKRSWHDDYLKWICGFANAQGGVFYIGKDDNGDIVNVPDHKKLMDDLPNKIRNSMGITADINLYEETGKHYIEIVIPPYSVPISLRGRYYYRSGSTKQELTGASLNEFLLQRSGKTWNDIIEPRASLEDIDEKTVSTFIKASEKAGRLPESDGLSLLDLLEKLRLTEKGQLKRAAIILFGKTPAKFYPNTFVKIGRFGKDDTDIKFQEIEEGNLIVLLQAVLNQLDHKFLIRSIEFSGMHRIEKGEYPLPAMREMLLNALVHRSYMGAPIQIRVYDDKISIWNEGILPEGLTLDSLKRSHSSRPRNPIIADVTFKGGYIDAWGRGTIKILDTCKEAELPEPDMKERDGGFIVTLYKDKLKVGENLTQNQLPFDNRRKTDEKPTKNRRKTDERSWSSEQEIKIIKFIEEHNKIRSKDIEILFNIKSTRAKEILKSMIDNGLITKKGKTKGSFYILKKIG